MPIGILFILNFKKSLHMANTYYQIYIQAIFAVKHRKALIGKSWRGKCFAVIGQLINETGCKTVIVNGTEDHVHCLIQMKPDTTISEVMKNAKSKSSKWINENNFLNTRFEWQSGFGAFSYNKRDIKDVLNYIKNQEEHHRMISFREEYLNFLKENEVFYDDRYIFRETE